MTFPNLKKKDILILYKIISFIQNRILRLEKDPEIIEKYELIPCLQVKDIRRRQERFSKKQHLCNNFQRIWR